MKDLNLLVWLTQLGLSVAVPPVVFILLAVWLRNSFGWGLWVIWVAVVLGLYCAISGFIHSLHTLQRISNDKKKEPLPLNFNDHD